MVTLHNYKIFSYAVCRKNSNRVYKTRKIVGTYESKFFEYFPICAQAVGLVKVSKAQHVPKVSLCIQSKGFKTHSGLTGRFQLVLGIWQFCTKSFVHYVESRKTDRKIHRFFSY